tara:strand:+ start:1192 stop:1428 length:237 start_codon:yes stop_codon:yes gene_type:complete
MKYIDIKKNQVWQENKYKNRIFVIMNINVDSIHMFAIDNLEFGNVLYTQDTTRDTLQKYFTLIADKYIMLRDNNSFML